MREYTETHVNLSGIIDYTESKSVVDGKDVITYTPKTDNEGNIVTGEAISLVEDKKAKELIDFQSKHFPDQPAISVDKLQTFQYREIDSLDEAVPMLVAAGLPEEKATEMAATFFNRGWTLAQHKSRADFMKSNDPVEGVYDLATDAATPTERRKADPVTKLNKMLQSMGINLTVDQLKAMQESGEEINA